MKIIQDGSIFLSYQKKKAALNIKDKSIIFRKPSEYSKPLAVVQKGRLCLIKKCKTMIGVKLKQGNLWLDKKRKFSWKTLIYFLFITFEAQNLSNKKYQTELAKGSTIASVNAI